MFRALALLACSLAPIGAATAQSAHNTNAPVNVSADHGELQDKAKRAIFSGNVIVRQAEMMLNAARITVAYTGQVVDGSPQVSRLDASGGVTVTRPDQSARSNFAVYDLNRRVVTMLGAVTLTQSGNTVNGARLTINLDTGRAVIDGSAVGGAAPGAKSSGGRVSGTFSVPKRTN